MIKKHRVALTCSFPKWVRAFFSFCGIFTLIFFTAYIFWVIYSGQLFLQLLRVTVFGGSIIVILWVYPKILFYSVFATEKGLESKNIFEENKLLTWNEIVEVKRPRFGIPVDFAYVISKNKDRLRLIRSMNNYRELIQLIKNKAPNLETVDTRL